MTKERMKQKYDKLAKIKRSGYSLIKLRPLNGGGVLRPVKYSVYFDETNKVYYYGKYARSQKDKYINSYFRVDDAFNTTQTLNKNNIRK